LPPDFQESPHAACAAPSEDGNGLRAPGAIFKIDAHDAGAAPSDGENEPRALGAIFKRDAHTACTAPSDGENEPRTPGYFQESVQMLYFVQQKRGNQPYSRHNVVKCATFRAMFLDLKPFAPKLLHKMQHYPSSGAKGAENVAFFAGFVAACARGGPR